jgi:hypothetical protein
MAKSKREGLKRSFLLSYLLVCVVLIGMILVNGLSDPDGEGKPGFYRATVGSYDGIYAAQTEAAEFFQTTPTPDPAAGEPTATGN